MPSRKNHLFKPVFALRCALVCALAGLGLALPAAAAADPIEASPTTSPDHACDDPAATWFIKMRFWSHASNGDSQAYPSDPVLNEGLNEARDQFVEWAILHDPDYDRDCNVDVVIRGERREDGAYQPRKANGSAAYSRSYDIVWDVFPSRKSLDYCGMTYWRPPGEPIHIEEPTSCVNDSMTPGAALLFHEFWHAAVEFTLQPNYGLRHRGLVPIDDLKSETTARSYGYSSESDEDFIHDMLAGWHSPDRRLWGLSREEWALGTRLTGKQKPPEGPGPEPRPRVKIKRVKLDRGHGSARIRVSTSAPGLISVAKTRKLRRARARADAAGSTWIRIRPTHRARKQLRKHPLRVRVRVVLRSDSGGADRAVRRIRLKLRRR